MNRGSAKPFELTNERSKNGKWSTTIVELGDDGTSSCVDDSKFSITSRLNCLWHTYTDNGYWCVTFSCSVYFVFGVEEKFGTTSAINSWRK